MRAVADDELDDAVDEVLDVAASRSRSRTVTSLCLLGHDERVRERREPVAVGPVQDDDRLLDHDALGHLDERAAGEERVVQHA